MARRQRSVSMKDVAALAGVSVGTVSNVLNSPDVVAAGTLQRVEEAMLAAPGARPGAAQVQLLAPTDPGSTLARFLDRSGPGLQQLAYRVTDVEAVSAVLRERGVRLLYDAPRRGTSDSRINFVHPKDAGGVLVELVEPAATGH